MMCALSEQERHLLRHALGLVNGRGQIWRNHYCAGDRDALTWRGLVTRGLAIEWHHSACPDPMFMVRHAGVDRVLLPGETITPEQLTKLNRLEDRLVPEVAA